MKIALIIEYDGTRYHGSQIQDNVPTIQGELEKSIFMLTGEKTRTYFAGRTDHGVHARGQVVAFKTLSPLYGDMLVRALNHYLPRDIVVRDAFIVSDDFDPRRNAVRREYRYYIWNDVYQSPLHRLNTFHVRRPLNIDMMKQACGLVVGTHDYISFAGSLDGRKSTIRTVFSADVAREGPVCIFSIIANSFLTRQVRNTVGTLIRIGSGKMDVDSFKALFVNKKPSSAGPTAPPHGLYLMKIEYASGLQ